MGTSVEDTGSLRLRLSVGARNPERGEPATAASQAEARSSRTNWRVVGGGVGFRLEEEENDE